MSSNNNKFKLLRYFSILMGTTSNSDSGIPRGIGITSQVSLSKISGVTTKSIRAYNEFLLSQEIIYVFSPNDYQFDDKGIRSLTNTYGRYCDKEKIIECGNSHVQKYGFNAVAEQRLVKKHSNSHSRSMSNMFRYVRDKGKVYEYETMKKIYFSMIEQNEKLRQRYYRDEDYDRYKKDLSVFRGYDFYSELP
ncbi:MAG: hypothetical protein RSF40_01745 [Oscillospiraceae bacterium]